MCGTLGNITQPPTHKHRELYISATYKQTKKKENTFPLHVSWLRRVFIPVLLHITMMFSLVHTLTIRLCSNSTQQQVRVQILKQSDAHLNTNLERALNNAAWSKWKLIDAHPRSECATPFCRGTPNTQDPVYILNRASSCGDDNTSPQLQRRYIFLLTAKWKTVLLFSPSPAQLHPDTAVQVRH